MLTVLLVWLGLFAVGGQCGNYNARGKPEYIVGAIFALALTTVLIWLVNTH